MRLKTLSVIVLLLACSVQARVAPTVSGFAVAARWNGSYNWGSYGRIMKYDIVNGVTVKTSVLYNGLGRFATINPDGQNVAFFRGDTVRWDYVSPASIAVMSVSGATPPEDILTGANVSTQTALKGFLDWPTGDWIFYGKATDNAEGTTELWKVNYKTKQNIKVCSYTNNEHIWQCGISNDGLKAIVRPCGTMDGEWGFTIGAPVVTLTYNFPLMGCGAGISSDGAYVLGMESTGHQDISVAKWDKTPMIKFTAGLMNSWSTFFGVAFNNNRFACNDPKWVCLQAGLDNRASNWGGNQVLVNWADSQVVRTSSADTVLWDGNGNTLTADQNEAGDFWVGPSTVTPASVPHAGGTWVKTGTLNNSTVFALASIGTNLFAGTANGMFLSVNNGTDWSAINTGLPAGVAIRSLAVSGTKIIAGTLANGAYASTDNGAHWSAISTGLLNGTAVYALFADNTNFYAATNAPTGFNMSVNSGTAWTSPGTGLPTFPSGRAVVKNGSNIFAGAIIGGMVVSANNGTSWTRCNSGLPAYAAIVSLAASGTTVFAGTNGGIFKTTNNGANWSAANTNLPAAASFYALTVSGTRIFAGAYQGGVFTSSDNGANWSAQDSGMPAKTSVYSLVANGTYLFAGTLDGSVYRVPLPGVAITEAPALMGPVAGDRVVLRQTSGANRPSLFTINLEAKRFSFQVFDIQGRMIYQSGNREISSNTTTTVLWNSASIRNGVYLVQCRSGNQIQTQELIIRK